MHLLLRFGGMKEVFINVNGAGCNVFFLLVLKANIQIMEPWKIGWLHVCFYPTDGVKQRSKIEERQGLEGSLRGNQEDLQNLCFTAAREGDHEELSSQDISLLG